MSEAELNAEAAVLEHRKAIGRDAHARWLARNLDQIGVNSKPDLVESYL